MCLSVRDSCVTLFAFWGLRGSTMRIFQLSDLQLALHDVQTGLASYIVGGWL